MANTKHSSDEIKDLDCEHCKRDGCRGITATGFCEDCCDFVCDTCLRYHRRYEPDHIFKQTNEVSLESHSEICDKHSDEFIKFYCELCDDVACSVCKRQYHSNCTSLVHVSKYRTNLEDTKGTNLVAFINKSKAKVHFMRKNIEHCLKCGDTLKDNVKSTVRKLKEKSDKEFDMIETEIEELALPDQTKLQTCLKDANEIENYISRVNLASQGYKKLFSVKKIQKVVENLKNETETIERATSILEYTYVLGGVQQQRITCIKESADENDTVEEGPSETLENDLCEVDNAESVTKSLKLLPTKDGIHRLGLFLQTFLFELTILACWIVDYRHVPIAISPLTLGVGLFLSCLGKLVFFMQITDFTSHKYGMYIGNILFKLWSIIASCFRVLLLTGILIVRMTPYFIVVCVLYLIKKIN